jgi:hypothetical protein
MEEGFVGSQGPQQEEEEEEEYVSFQEVKLVIM